MQIGIGEVKAFCLRREVDLALAPAVAPSTIYLHGRFSGAGDFFSVHAEDVEYVDIAGCITVGDLDLVADAREVFMRTEKWSHLIGVYSGPALMIRSADAESWASAKAHELFVLVANKIVFRSGNQWGA